MPSETKGAIYGYLCIVSCNNVRSSDLWKMHFVGDKNR